MFGRGSCRVQPMLLDAFADLAVEAIDGAHAREVLPVAGPRDWTFLEMVRAIRAAVGSRALIVPAPAWASLAALNVAGLLLRDVVLTRDEILGLTREYLHAEQPIRRGADFDAWLSTGGVSDTLGVSYASELARHFRIEPGRA